MSEKLKLELNLTTPAPFNFDMRKLIGDAVEQAAVNIRDGQASGTLIINRKPVGDYMITKVEDSFVPFTIEDEEPEEPGPCAMTLAKRRREEEML